ncbi:MAG: M20/M25/M40 family metallo-hydrolase [Candidatus Neomarinimicrobiota bacterium]
MSAATRILFQRHYSRFLLTAGLAGLLTCSCLPLPQTKPGGISGKRLQEHVTYLASDALQGRKPGSAGDKLAAEYIRRQFDAAGLEPLAQAGFQPFQVVTALTPGANNYLTFGNIVGRAGENFTSLAFSENAELVADVTFAGYGFDFSTDSLTRRDYEAVDVSGRWVLLLRGDPEPDNSDSPYLPFSSLRDKALSARDRGAAGVIFVSGPVFDENDELIDLYYEGQQRSLGLPVLQITRSLADSLLALRGVTVAELEQKLNDGQSLAAFDLGTDLTAWAEIVKTEARTQNVLAILPGSDPVLKDEFIVLGAHYDHLGMGGPGSGSRRPDTSAIHNGADDNASGVAALLEIASVLAKRRPPLKRSIVFAAFAAEEMGLLGSKQFTNEPPVPLDRITAMFNLDMLGNASLDTVVISVGGTGTAAGLQDILVAQAECHGLRTSLSPEGYGPSDHAAFYSKDIPVLFFFTGAHDRYHTPADDAEFLNYAGEKQIADFIADLAGEIADRPTTLVFQEAGPKTRDSYRRRFKVSLGVMPDHAAVGITGMRVDLVMPNRPAALAGIRKGDIIVAMEGRPVGDIYEYMHRLAEFKVGQRISVEVLRDGRKQILIIDL